MKKRAFGGYTVTFKGRRDTMERVMGREDLSPSEMVKKLWAYIRAHQLGRTG